MERMKPSWPVVLSAALAVVVTLAATAAGLVQPGAAARAVELLLRLFGS